MPKFKDTASLMAYIHQAVDSSLNTEVFEQVKQTELTAIKEDVYEAYKPSAYVRRSANGGLGDESHIVKVGGAAANGILAVANITPPNPYLNGLNSTGGISTTPSGSTTPALIEFYIYSPTGYGYDYWRWGKARKFTEGTINRLKASGGCVTALKQGLLRQGIATR